VEMKEFLDKYKYYCKDWPTDKLIDLKDFLTCEYTDAKIGKMYESFHKTKSIKTRIKVVKMFKDYLTAPDPLDVICKKLGVE